MKVRIIKEPSGLVQGVSLASYKLGQVYDIPANLADYLVLEGYAQSEMRISEQSPPSVERRKSPRN